MPLYDEAVYKPCCVLLNKISTESSVHVIHGESNHIIKMPDAKGSKQDLQGATNSSDLSKTLRKRQRANYLAETHIKEHRTNDLTRTTNRHKANSENLNNNDSDLENCIKTNSKIVPSLNDCRKKSIFKTSDVSSFSSDDSDFEHNQNILYKNWKTLSIHRSRARILTDSDSVSETDIQADYAHNTGTPIKAHRSKDLSGTRMKELGANYLTSTPKKSFRTLIKGHEANDSDDLSVISVKKQRSNDFSGIPIKKNTEKTLAPNDDHTKNTPVPNAKHNLPQLEMNKYINDIIKPCSVILVKLNKNVMTDCFEGSLGKLNGCKSKISCHDSYSKDFCSEKRHSVELSSNHSMDSSLKECSNESFKTVVWDKITKQYSVPLRNVDISEISDATDSISYVEESGVYDATFHSNKNAMLHSARKKQNIDKPVIKPKHSEPEPSECYVREEMEISSESFVSISGSLISSADFSDFSDDETENADEINHPMTYYIDKFISDTSNYENTSINVDSTCKYQSKKKIKYFDSSDSSTKVPDVNDVNKEKQISHNLRYSSRSKKKSKFYFNSSDSSEVSDVDDANKEKQISHNLRDSLKSKRKRKYFDSSDSSTEVSDVDVVNKEKEIFDNERDSLNLSDKNLSECNQLKKQNDAEVNFNLKPCCVVLHKRKEIDVIGELQRKLQNNSYLHEYLALQVQDKKSIKSKYKRTYIDSSDEDVNSVSNKLTTDNEFNNSNHSVESEAQKIFDQVCINDNNEDKIESNKMKTNQPLGLDRKSQAGEKTCQPLAVKTPNRTLNSKYKRICINTINEDLSAVSSVSNKMTSANKFDNSQLPIVTKNSCTSPANNNKKVNFYLTDQNLKDCDSVKFLFKKYSDGNCVNESQCVNEFCELTSPCVSCKVLLSKLNKDTLTSRVGIPCNLNSENITQIQNDDSNIKASIEASCMIGFKNMFCNQNVKKQRSIVQENGERVDCGTASDASKEADSDENTVIDYSEFKNSVANFETVQTLKDCRNEVQLITNGKDSQHNDFDMKNNVEKYSKNLSPLNDCREKPILKTSGDSSFLRDNSDFEPNKKIRFKNSKKLPIFRRHRILTDSDSTSETDIQNEHAHYTTHKQSIKFCKVFIKSKDKYKKNSMFHQNPKSPVMPSRENCNKNAASENITHYPFKSRAGDTYVVDLFECENIKKIFVTVSLKENSKSTEQFREKSCNGNKKCQFDLKTHPSILKRTSADSEKVDKNNTLAEQDETLSPKVSSKNSDFCDKRFNKSEKSIECRQEEITLKSKSCNTNLEENNNASSAKSGITDMEGICDLDQDLVDLDYVKNHEKASSYSTVTADSDSNFKYKKVDDSFCVQCSTKFSNSQDNCNHVCSGKQKSGYLCEFCEKIFPTKRSVSVHKRIHKS